MIYKYEDVESVHLEITQKCQAACPMCARNQNGGDDNPHIDNSELTLDDCKKIFSIEFIQRLKSITLCGNLGDPIIASDTLEVIQYFREHNSSLWIGMNTNAGARSIEWWTNLAHTIGRQGAVIFSLDGLSDTNHLYRQHVNWDICMRSATAFIAAGGRARWDYLIFGHNEHQVLEAEALSLKMGFEQFVKKKTGRFYDAAKHSGKESHQGFNKSGSKTVNLVKPENIKHMNKALTGEQKLTDKYGSLDSYYDVAKIHCKVKDKKEIYISAEGLMLPCCWTADRMYKWWLKDPKTEQIWDFIEKNGGKNSINIVEHGLKAVMDSDILNDIENSWDIIGCNNGKLKICAMKCGVEFDPFGEQFK